MDDDKYFDLDLYLMKFDLSTLDGISQFETHPDSHIPTNDRFVLEINPSFRKDLPIEYVGFDLTKLDPNPPFRARSFELYHGTSIDALDQILRQGTMRTAADLLQQEELIWGELMRDGNTKPGRIQCGPAFLTAAKLERLGVELTDYDRAIFGHADSIFFANDPSRCLGYIPKESENQAIIGVNRIALGDWGYKFTNCKSEGIKHDGHLPITYALGSILVDQSNIEKYKQKLKHDSRYFTGVHAISDIRDQ